MANGKTCPTCGKDIGVWAIVAAGVPTRIRCPYCQSRLRYDAAIAVIALPFAVVVLAALVAHEAAVDVGVARPWLFVAILLVVTWMPVELLLALYLRDHRTLRVVESQPGPPAKRTDG
jgi:DNA-directed RNA polymerase subunit RPC12/RpoP